MELNMRDIGNYHRCMVVMGLIPCSTKKLQQTVQKVYCVVLVLSTVGVSTYGIHDVRNSMDYKNDLVISFSVMTICFISDIITLVVILLEMIIMYDQHIDFINKSQQIYMKYHHKTGHKISSSACGAWMRRKYYCLGSVLGCSLLIYFLIATFKVLHHGYCKYSALLTVCIRSRFLQMSLYVDIMHNCLHLLNKQLQEIVTIKLNKSLMLLHIDCSDAESLQRLLILKEIYTDIAQSVELYNQMFGCSIANIVVCCYLNITVHLYWVFMALDGFYPHQVLYSAISVLIPLATIITAFTNNCEQLQRSNFKTMSLLKQLMGTTTNPAYKAVAYEFALQIYNKPLHVSAKGFFQVHLGTLMALGTYIASMMVILVQFSLAEFADREFRSRKNFTTLV